MLECLSEWRRVLRPTGSVFLNIGDTFHNRSLAGIPARVEAAAADDGWIIRNRIIWAKDGGMPDPAKNRLASRHEAHLRAHSGSFAGLRLQGRLGDLAIYQYVFDLSADPLANEEARFASAMDEIVASSAAQLQTSTGPLRQA